MGYFQQEGDHGQSQHEGRSPGRTALLVLVRTPSHAPVDQPHEVRDPGGGKEVEEANLLELGNNSSTLGCL